MSEVQVFNETPETIKDISGEVINLSSIDGWDNMDSLQKLWLSGYFDYYPNQSLTCLKTGISPSKLKQWKQSHGFFEVFEFIATLKNDELAAIHYEESKVNSKIRGQVLRAVKAEGYEPTTKSTTNNLTVIGETTMASLANELKKLSS